jgi:hypothetical protein
VRDVVNYLLAMGRQWKTLATGGSVLVFGAAVAQYATGWQVPRLIGGAIVASTLITATFKAWQFEHVKRQLDVRVTGYKFPTGVMEGYPLVVFALLINKGMEARGVRWADWSLNILAPDGGATVHLEGHLSGELAPIGPEQQFSIEVLFPAPADVIPPNATLRLSGFDIHGHDIAMVFPASIGSARPHTPRASLPRVRVEVARESRNDVPHSPGMLPVLWGLRIVNDGAAADFEATVKICSGVTTGDKPNRIYRLAFARSDMPRTRIFNGGDDRIFFALAWEIPLYKSDSVAKELWFFDEQSRGNRMLSIVTTSGVGNSEMPTAELEVSIVSDPPMADGWTRRYRFGPGSELRSLGDTI